MAIQGSLNARLGKEIGLMEATFIVHILGTLLVLALLLIGLGSGSFARLGQAPWYVYLGGLLGVAIIYGVVRSIPEVGVASATTAIIVAQVSTAALIDQFGIFGLEQIAFTWLKAFGFALLSIGAYLILR